MEVNPLIAFGAGLISIFSPCVLPLLPAIVASSTDRGRFRPIAIVLGLSISFTTMGLVASAFGSAFTAYSSYLFAAAILLIIAMGFWMLFDLHLPYNTPRLGLIDRVSRKTYDIPTEGIASGLVLGLALGIDLFSRLCRPHARYCLFGSLVVLSRRQIVQDYLDKARRWRCAHCGRHILGPTVPTNAYANLMPLSP